MLNDETSREDEAEKKAKKEADGLIVLMERFNIDPMDEDSLFFLALRLARRHEANWPNVKATRGAPKGSRTQTGKISKGEIWQHNRGVQLAYSIEKKKKSGRPKVPKFNPKWIDDIKTTHGLSGHGSDKEAIKVYVERYAPPAARQSEIKYIQKRLSEERKKIPKT